VVFLSLFFPYFGIWCRTSCIRPTYCTFHSRLVLPFIWSRKIQGESLARGPKLLSIYTAEQRRFLVHKYWQTGAFKACQAAFRTEFVERRAPSKCCIQKLVKKLETRGSPSNACPLLSFEAYWRAKCTKIHPAQSKNSRTLYAKRFKPSTSTFLGKVFQNLEKRIQVCLDMKGDPFQHRLWAGPVLHRSRYVYINFQVII